MGTHDGTGRLDRRGSFADTGLDEAFLELVIDEHRRGVIPRLEKNWAYFRDEGRPFGGSSAEPAGPSGVDAWGRVRGAGQAMGLPARFRRTAVHAGGVAIDEAAPEVVIENDIAWRIQTMVDFMFGRPVQILSTASDPELRRTIERVLDAVWEASGGIVLMQDMALLGHVHGYVDLLVRIDEAALTTGGRLIDALESGSRDDLADLIRIEPVEPRRGIAVLDPDDYRRIEAFVVHLERSVNEIEDGPVARRGWRSVARGNRGRGWARRRTGTVTEVLGRGRRVVMEDGAVVARESSLLLPGVVPVVHIQNLSQPFRYEGIGEVEPLIGLQDELNTRLSDRASRVTMSSFKMYLAKRLDGFERAPVGPGRVWSTDDPDASIEAFGGDTSSPSESEHIEQIREAMDKVSGVPPLAGGVVRAKIGNLSSANALRITLMSLLAKTARKRVTYGAGIEKVSRMVLTALDAAGVLRTGPGERGIRLVWPDPQPIDPASAVESAKSKLEIGVPDERVLAELGYGPGDAGVS
jgi:hypothetical protein